MKWILTLVALVVVAIPVAILAVIRWDAWFHNPEELAYTAPMQPENVLLTFGDKDGTTRNVSWQCDSIVRPSYLELVEVNHGDRLLDSVEDRNHEPVPVIHVEDRNHEPVPVIHRVEAEGEVFRSRSGVAAYYVARLRNLQSGAHYAYRAVTDGKASPWYEFYVGGENPQQLSFLYVGDVQDTLNGEANRFLREALHRHPQAEFLVCGGDLTERPTRQHWDETFRDIDSVAQAMPMLNVTGNHDYLKGVIMSLERRFPLTFSYFLDSKVGDNMVYTLCYGPAQFFLLDSNRELPYLMTQRQWLKEQLEQSTARWKIVVLHHPLFSLKGNNNLIQRWVFNDLIEEYGVDLVLQGHEHNYARMTRHDNEGRAVTPVYTVSHCAPKNYRIQFDDRFDKFGISSRYYQTVDILADTLVLAAYEVYGHTLYDSLRIVKGRGTRGEERGWRNEERGTRNEEGGTRIEDFGSSIPEYMEYTPEPGSKRDREYAARIADYKRRHPERMKR